MAAEVGLDDLQAALSAKAGPVRGRDFPGNPGAVSRKGAAGGRRADEAEGQDGAGSGADVGGTAKVVGDDLGGRERFARAGALAQMVDEEQGKVPLAGDGGEEAENVAGALEAGLAAGGGRGQGVDHDEGRPQIADHIEEQSLLVRAGEVNQAAGAGGEHEEEAAAVDVPGLSALVKDGRGAFGIDDQHGAAGARDGGAIGKGLAVDQPPGEVKGDERLADAGRGAKEGEHATGDPGGPKPVDGREAVGHLLEGREWREGLFGWQQVDERMGQRLTVGEALGGLPDEREGIDVVLGAADAAVDGAPGLIEGGG